MPFSHAHGLCGIHAVCAGKSKGDAEAQLCSLYFLKSPLPWMQLAGAGAGPEEAGAAPGQAAQEGRLDCPCCDAKVGRFSLAGPGIACSCGAEVRPNDGDALCLLH